MNQATRNFDATRTLFQNYGVRDLAIVRGNGVFLYDDSGKEYLDFTAGIAVCSLGHAHPGVAEVLSAQARTLMHTSNLFLVPGQLELANKLVDLSGISDAKVMFVNSGTEANEAALKLARRYQYLHSREGEQRTKLLSLPHAFHGRTMGALSVTPKAAYHEGFEPLVPDCVSAKDFDHVIERVDDTIAACIVEIVQGEGGVLPVPHEFLRSLAQKLHQVGALLIVDEIQTGVARTGRFFAYEEAGIHPDIITMAKGLGNGFPVGAVIARGGVADAFTPGTHGTTFGGNPLAMAVANYVVDTVREEHFLKGVRERGEQIRAVLEKHFEQVTGLGLMWGFDVRDASQFASAALAEGLLVTKCGPKRIRIVPPLILTTDHVRLFEAKVEVIQSRSQ
jgi:acetylornithine/N-succinyldiaminopimelate aminotransferase